MTDRLYVTRRRFLGTVSTIGGLALLHPFSARAQGGQAHLRVISTSSCHAPSPTAPGSRTRSTSG